ncbi:cutinase family protein [Streptomyces sp. SID6673]|nr:cutinase family protein [Streptomyces sp. SID11726]NEB25589.1 cutinase family protein [Streptomyces sp. SID6673]
MTIGTVGVTVALALAPAATAVADTSPTAPGATFNLFIPGTWETSESADPSKPIGALKPIADRLRHDHGDSAVIYFLPYVARAFDNGESYGTSKATALENAGTVLRDYASQHPDARFTITGYSQGADAAGDLASAIGNELGPIAADAVLAVALLADPRAGTAGETVVGPREDGIGIADPRPAGMGSLMGRVSAICAPDDLYCSIDKSQNPLLGQLGTVLGKTPADAEAAVKKAATATTVLASVDIPGIIDGLTRLPRDVAAGDLRSAHEVSGTLNNRLRPLVTLASMVDFTEVSTTLALIPDETGLTKAASLLAAALAHVDFQRTADLVGRIQELTWSGVGAVAARTGAKTLPTTTTTPSDVRQVARELAVLSRTIVTVHPRTGTEVTAVSPDLRSMATAVTEIVATRAITDPATVVTDAVSAGSFYASDTHVHYGTLVVDAEGRDAIDWFGKWLSDSIARAS